MASNRLPAQLQPFTLAGSGAILGDTSVTLSSFNDIDGNALTMANFGTKAYGTLEPSASTQEEQISFTGVTSNSNGTVTLTGVSHVTFLSPYTETVGVSKSHAGGTRFVISNTSAYYSGFANTNDDETITQKWQFPDDETNRPRGITDTDTAVLPAYVTFGQLGRTSFAGTVNASTVQKGIVQEATLAQTEAGTDVGSTGAQLFVSPSSFLTAVSKPFVNFVNYGGTITAGDPVYLATDSTWKKALATAASTSILAVGIAIDSGINGDTGKRVQVGGIVVGLSGLTPGYVYVSDTGTLAATPGTFSKVIGYAYSATSLFLVPTLDVPALFGVNSAATTANFNESMTFFNTTAITGAQATTLSAGASSDATTLHMHEDMGVQDLFIDSTLRGNGIFTMNATGDVIVGTNAVVASTVKLIRWARNAQGSWYQTHLVDFGDTLFTNCHSPYPVIIGNFVYVPYSQTATDTSSVRRFALADLTGGTNCTFSGTAPSGGFVNLMPAFTDGTNLYIARSDSATSQDYFKYTISGTTLTNAATVTMASAVFRPNNIPAFYADATNVWAISNSNAGGATQNSIVKATIATGATVSTTTYGTFGYGWWSSCTSGSAFGVYGLGFVNSGVLYGFQVDQIETNAAFQCTRAVMFPLTKPS